MSLAIVRYACHCRINHKRRQDMNAYDPLLMGPFVSSAINPALLQENLFSIFSMPSGHRVLWQLGIAWRD